MAVSLQWPAANSRQIPAAVGNQRHAAGRRDAGAADHLHGHRAADDVWRIGRSAKDRRQADEHRQPAADRVRSTPAERSSCRTRRCNSPELVTKLQAIAQNNQDRRIFVRGDKDLAYGRIMEVMGTITQGGFTKVALLAEQPIAQPAKPAAAASSSQGCAPEDSACFSAFCTG